jgi:hypothetical protein
MHKAIHHTNEKYFLYLYFYTAFNNMYIERFEQTVSWGHANISNDLPLHRPWKQLAEARPVVGQW